jgi:glycosyltransferase involved in cell wall biosynthesis
MRGETHRFNLDGALVSVILPVYNREASIERAVRSVLAQTYRPLELIVVDDGSTDGTPDRLQTFGSDINVVAQPHAGAYAARNFGVRHARGEFIAFADSDDAWLPHLLAAEVPLMQRPEVGLVFGDAIHVTSPRSGAARTGLTCFRVSPPHRGRVADRFAWSNFVPTCTVLVRRRCFDEVGGFSEESETSSDYLMWFRIALRHELDYVAQPVAEYTVNPEGISYDLGKSIDARIRLFSRELERTSDERTRVVLRRLLFNLAVSLALAAVRGRARSVDHPLGKAWRTASTMAHALTAFWAGSFAMNQVRVRTRRFFS